MCDTPDEELEQMATQLCDEKGEFKESVLKEVPALKDVGESLMRARPFRALIARRYLLPPNDISQRAVQR